MSELLINNGDEKLEVSIYNGILYISTHNEVGGERSGGGFCNLSLEQAEEVILALQKIVQMGSTLKSIEENEHLG